MGVEETDCRNRFLKAVAIASVYDVAERASVTPATASRVLSGGDYPVRAETRARVLQAAAELSFQPNRLARALVTARTSTIGAIVHDISDPYFGEIVRGLEDAARLHGYQLFVCSSDRDAERELEYVQALLSYRVDGLVFAGGGIERDDYKRELRKTLDEFRSSGGAVVMLAPNSYKTQSVLPDNEGGARLLTRHLIGLGHRVIGFISGPEHLRTSKIRLQGHRAELEESGLGFEADLVESGHFTAQGGAKAMATLLERRSDITAVFASSDLMAFGVLSELAARSIRVPDDMSVAGFDDVRPAAYAGVPLTTVAVPMQELGAEGARVLLEVLAGKRPRARVLPVRLVERRSTAKVPTTQRIQA
ncbi:MAG: LacI family DNA-binding transcriptional regulator [Actinomycetota bacterium]